MVVHDEITKTFFFHTIECHFWLNYVFRLPLCMVYVCVYGKYAILAAFNDIGVRIGRILFLEQVATPQRTQEILAAGCIFLRSHNRRLYLFFNQIKGSVKSQC